MKTIKNILDLSLGELLLELYYIDEVDLIIGRLDYYNHIKKITNNFELDELKLLLLDIFSFSFEHAIFSLGESVEITGVVYIPLFEFDPKYKRHIADKNFLPKLFDSKISFCNPVGYKRLLDYANFAKSIFHAKYTMPLYEEFYKEAIETFTNFNLKIDTNKFDVKSIDLKRPNNTHKQQFSILEETGVIDYLKSKYNGISDVVLAEIIANILNKDLQNTRVMLSFTATKNKTSNAPKNKEFLNSLFDKIGLNK